MSSGSFQIQTYSWQTSLPVQACAGGYPQGTLFAVGNCATLQPYSFLEYQSSVGVPNTIDLSNYFASTITVSTNVRLGILQSQISSLYTAPKQIVSTISLTRWISGATETTFPFTFQSTIPVTYADIPTTVVNTNPYTFISSGFFGTVDSNIYTQCSGYSYNSTFPVLVSTIPSTFYTSTTTTIQYPLPFPSSTVSSITAPSYPFDFLSTTDLNAPYPGLMQTSNLWLGRELRQLIDSKQYNVFVEYQYNVYVSTNQDRYTWVSTIGVFGSPGTVHGVNGYEGRTTVTRLPEKQYMEVYTKQMFQPQPAGYETQLAPANCNFSITLELSKSAFSTGPADRIYADVFVPGENNFTFTLVPISSIV